MRCVATLALWVGVACAAARAHAPQSPQVPTDAALPPALSEGSAVTDAMRTLRTEMDELGRTPASQVRDAKVSVRRVAFDLLFHGAGAPADAQAAAVAGLRLHGLRGDVDALIEASSAGTRPEDARATEAIARFAKGAAHGMASAPDCTRPEAALAPLMAPLTEAASHAASRGGAAWTTAWPGVAELGAAGAAAARGAGPGTDAGASPAPAAALAEIEAIDPGVLPAEMRSLASDLRTRWIAEARQATETLSAGTTGAKDASGAAEVLAARDADARRVMSLPAWIDAVGAARAASRAPFAAAARQWLAALRDPARAPAARTSMAAFEADLRALQPGSLELRLRRGDQRARDACAGQADELLREVDARRTAWAQAWGDGRGKPAASVAAIRSARTLEALDAVDRAAGSAAAERSLSAWGGFAASADGWRVHPKALRGHAALAAEALAARDDAGLDAALAGLDRDLPLAMLAGQLTRTLADWLPTRPGLGPRLAAVAGGPDADAWLGPQRTDLMLLSRLAIEEGRAAARRDARLEAQLRGASQDVAWRVLERAGAGMARMRDLRDAERQADARAAATRTPR